MIPAGRRRYWLAGIALACIGVLTARVLTLYVGEDARGYVRFLGVALALGGLLVIMLGTRRKG